MSKKGYGALEQWFSKGFTSKPRVQIDWMLPAKYIL